MEKKKLHIEIGIDGEKSIVNMQGSALDLLLAATYIVKVFYQSFAENGAGHLFKSTMRSIVNSDDSPIYDGKEPGNGGEEHEKQSCGRGND